MSDTTTKQPNDDGRGIELDEMVQCWIVYNDGMVRKHEMAPHNVEPWVEAQAKWRPGVAVIVSGVVRQCGYLTQKRCDEYAAQMNALNTQAQPHQVG